MSIKFLSIIAIIFFITPSYSSDCEPWPENIPNLHDCCVFPHYLDLYTYAACMKHCIENHEKDPTCLLKCYLNVTNIIHDDELDVHGVKEIYMENVDTKAWEPIILNSIESCKSLVNASNETNLKEELFSFFGCVKNESLPHCLEFYGTHNCYETEKYFLNCSNVTFDCSTWPDRFANETLINCCNFPQIFDDSFTEKCEMQCVFDGDVLGCIEKCRYFDTGIVGNGTINVNAIKRRIQKHRNYKKDWNAVIDEAVGTCLGEYYIKHSENVSSFSYSQFESCIDFRMSAACVAIRNDYECRTLKSYMQSCPESKPDGFVFTKRDARSINFDYDDNENLV
ncbi:hypothetical protein PVAND_000106 [Polypedilum vanderplanki]|uniref:Uncharacterized protein n=1 Tax=Polypedilum vanderplanki TaxID=319348 RepID=A0A9J6BJ20_POLVA|nr:hypothetical protein PVAND_000106 [Polypedilum vanderplanki]